MAYELYVNKSIISEKSRDLVKSPNFLQPHCLSLFNKEQCLLLVKEPLTNYLSWMLFKFLIQRSAFFSILFFNFF